MKVKIQREVDVDRLLINLDEKSQCKTVGMCGYDVNVSKQMLRDAHDVILQYANTYGVPIYEVDELKLLKEQLEYEKTKNELLKAQLR